jgi:hypothetical protein
MRWELTQADENCYLKNTQVVGREEKIQELLARPLLRIRYGRKSGVSVSTKSRKDKVHAETRSPRSGEIGEVFFHLASLAVSSQPLRLS